MVESSVEVINEDCDLFQPVGFRFADGSPVRRCHLEPGDFTFVNRHSAYFNKGELVTLRINDRTFCPPFTKQDGSDYWYANWNFLDLYSGE